MEVLYLGELFHDTNACYYVFMDVSYDQLLLVHIIHMTTYMYVNHVYGNLSYCFGFINISSHF